jgi:hypothetical protein
VSTALTVAAQLERYKLKDQEHALHKGSAMHKNTYNDLNSAIRTHATSVGNGGREYDSKAVIQMAHTWCCIHGKWRGYVPPRDEIEERRLIQCLLA